MVTLIVLALIAVLGNNWLQSTTIEVESARLPASFDGYCIVQVSDLHGRQFGPNHSRLMKRVREARPDLIVMTGDLINQGVWDARYVETLGRGFRDIAPVYFVTGNHEEYACDQPDLLDRLEGAEVHVLAGTSLAILRGSSSISLAGIPDPRHFRRNEGIYEATVRWKAALAALRAPLGPERYTMLLSHRPEFLAEYAEMGFDLVLSGHAHGGQVRLPLVGPIYAPNQGWRPAYTSGRYRRSGTTLVVSRGLGNSSFPIRVFNRPEIIVVRLRRIGS